MCFQGTRRGLSPQRVSSRRRADCSNFGATRGICRQRLSPVRGAIGSAGASISSQVGRGTYSIGIGTHSVSFLSARIRKENHPKYMPEPRATSESKHASGYEGRGTGTVRYKRKGQAFLAYECLSIAIGR